MARVVEDALARGASDGELDGLVDDAAREVDARVTIIAPDGRVLADSVGSPAPSSRRVENHGGRSEVVGALAGRVSRAERVSATVGVRLLYAAVPIRRAGRDRGRRAAEPRHRADRGAGQGTLAQRRARRPAGARRERARLDGCSRRASAARSPRSSTPPASSRAATSRPASALRREDELGELARIINRSADELQLRLGEIARDRGRTDAILSAMDDGVLAVDHRGTVTLANPSLTRAMAMSSPLGRHYLETIRQPEVAALVEEVLRSGERRAVEVEILALRRSFTVTGVPFPGAEGAPHGAVLTFNDTTERQRLDAMRRDFVANASHELRTPLTSIRGFVEALEDGAKDEPGTAERFLGKIRTHADRMAALVEDLLELSRLESGARAPEPDQTRPGDVAAEVVASFASRPHASRSRCATQERGEVRGRHRPRAAAPHPREPGRQRRQVHARGRQRRRHDGGRPGRRRPDRGPGRRPRHRSRAPRAGVRALLPGRQGQEPRARRDRARTRDREAPGREHRRAGDAGERARPGLDVHRSAPGSARPGPPVRAASPPSRPRLVLAAMKPWVPLLLSVVVILHLAAPGGARRRGRGPAAHRRHRWSPWTRPSACSRTAPWRCAASASWPWAPPRELAARFTAAKTIDATGRHRDARPREHPHPRADDAHARRGRRRGADGLAHEVHLAGGRPARDARVRDAGARVSRRGR